MSGFPEVLVGREFPAGTSPEQARAALLADAERRDRVRLLLQGRAPVNRAERRAVAKRRRR